MKLDFNLQIKQKQGLALTAQVHVPTITYDQTEIPELKAINFKIIHSLRLTLTDTSSY